LKKLQYYINQLRAEFAYLPKNLGYLFSSKKKAIYIGCTGHENLGDEGILKAIRLMLQADFFLYDIFYPKPSSGRYLRKLLVKNPDYIILGGGTIIRKKASESYLKILLNVKKKYPKAKIAILGPGVADPDFANYIGFPVDIPNWKSFLKQSSFVAVRGTHSKKTLESWKLDNPVHIFHDPAVYFTRNSFNKKSKNKKIGLNFANIGDRIFGKNNDLISEFALTFVRKLQEEGWEIYLYPTTPSDLFYMLEGIGLKNNKGMHIYSNYLKLDESLDFLESLDVFLGQRLHSIIFAATVGTPFFALEYEPKTSDFLDTINLLNYSCRVDQLDVDFVWEKIRNIYNNLETEQDLLKKKITEAKEDQLRCLNLFLKDIRS
jgi:polysaccharide pyruvyl transferase WcaK-like protein